MCAPYRASAKGKKVEREEHRQTFGSPGPGASAVAARSLLAVVGLDGRVRFANRALRRLLDLDWDSHRLPPVLHRDDLVVVEKLRPGDEPVLLALRFRRGTGGWLQVPLTCRMLGTGDNRRLLVASPVLANAVPSPPEHRGDGVALGLYVIVDGRFRYVSPAFARMTGYSERELLGRRSMDLVLPEDRRLLRRRAARALAGDRWLQSDYRVLTKSGAVRWFTESVARLRSGSVQGTLGACLDVTARRENAEALREREHLLEAAITHPDMLVLSGPAGRFLYVNEAHRDVLGYGVLDLLGTALQDIVHPDDRQLVLAGITAWTPGEPLVLELRARHKDGHYVWLESRIEVIFDGGLYQGAVILSRDITLRRKVEQEMRRIAEEGRAPAEALALFAYGAARGESTPLHLVSTYAELVARRYHTMTDGRDVEAFVRGLADETLRFLALITDLLALEPPDIVATDDVKAA